MFAPQKGADDQTVEALTRRLQEVAAWYRKEFGVDVEAVAGGGAAGGLGGGLFALGATLRAGFELIADEVGLDARLASADLVLTGEGQLDADLVRWQSRRRGASSLGASPRARHHRRGTDRGRDSEASPGDVSRRSVRRAEVDERDWRMPPRRSAIRDRCRRLGLVIEAPVSELLYLRRSSVLGRPPNPELDIATRPATLSI